MTVNTEFEGHVKMKKLTTKVEILEQQLELTKQTLDRQKFRLSNMADNDKMVAFYTGFPSYACLKACFNFLGPAVHQLAQQMQAVIVPGWTTMYPSTSRKAFHCFSSSPFGSDGTRWPCKEYVQSYMPARINILLQG